MPHNILQSKFNTDRSMIKFNKHTLCKHVSKFLSKMFWHFNQAVPDYSSFNCYSMDNYIINSDYKRQLRIKKNSNENPYKIRYRSCQRTSTLMSIQEENENELMNYK